MSMRGYSLGSVSIRNTPASRLRMGAGSAKAHSLALNVRCNNLITALCQDNVASRCPESMLGQRLILLRLVPAFCLVFISKANHHGTCVWPLPLKEGRRRFDNRDLAIIL